MAAILAAAGPGEAHLVPGFGRCQPSNAFLIDVVAIGEIDGQIASARDRAVEGRFDHGQGAVVEIAPQLEHVAAQADVGVGLFPLGIGDGEEGSDDHRAEQVQKQDRQERRQEHDRLAPILEVRLDVLPVDHVRPEQDDDRGHRRHGDDRDQLGEKQNQQQQP